MTITSTITAVVDCESTGLDPRIHQPYEVSVWRSDASQPTTWNLPHTLEHADLVGLRIGGYFDRGFSPYTDDDAATWMRRQLIQNLHDVTLIGSNPAFDSGMLGRFVGCQVWSHRMIDVSQAGMWLLGHDVPKGLAALAGELRDDCGFDIPAPDHTAEGDVRTTKAVYDALCSIRARRT